MLSDQTFLTDGGGILYFIFASVGCGKKKGGG